MKDIKEMYINLKKHFDFVIIRKEEDGKFYLLFGDRKGENEDVFEFFNLSNEQVSELVSLIHYLKTE